MKEGAPIPSGEKLQYSPIFVYYRQGEDHPNEDRYMVLDSIACVADGVSRSKDNGVYPNPSGSALAAQIVVEEATAFLSREPILGAESLVEALSVANRAVWKLNVKHEILPGKKLDYRVHDYFGTCAAIVAVSPNNELLYAAIGDTQIAVFGEDDICAFMTPNIVKPLEKIRDGKKFSSKDEKDVYWRRDLRHHIERPSYGVLNGEPEAINSRYVFYGSHPLTKGDLVIVFSDGMEGYVGLSEFRDLLRTNPTPEQIDMLVENIRKNYQVEHKFYRDEKGKRINDFPSGHDDKTLVSFMVK